MPPRSSALNPGSRRHGVARPTSRATGAVRAAASAALCALLAACGGCETREPFLESRAPPILASRFLPPEGWAWGLVQAGHSPAQRYGVNSPPVAPRGQVLVVTGFGESAEGWFETVSDLNARGLTVWVLERAGQGGSGRMRRGEAVHAESIAPDVHAIRAMLELIIRSPGSPPLVVLAEGDGAAAALLALESGPRADGLILSAPALAPARPLSRLETAAVRAGLGFLAPGGGWRRDQAGERIPLPPARDPWRTRAQHAWEIANPDLRMGGATLSWRAGLAEGGARAARDVGALRTPTLALGADRDGATLCSKIARCRTLPVPGEPASPHLAADRARTPWLDAVAAFARAPGRPL